MSDILVGRFKEKEEYLLTFTDKFECTQRIRIKMCISERLSPAMGIINELLIFLN